MLGTLDPEKKELISQGLRCGRLLGDGRDSPILNEDKSPLRLVKLSARNRVIAVFMRMEGVYLT